MENTMDKWWIEDALKMFLKKSKKNEQVSMKKEIQATKKYWWVNSFIYYFFADRFTLKKFFDDNQFNINARGHEHCKL